MDVLIVTWYAGGGSQMALGLGRVLAAAGRRVRILAPAAYATRIAACGCEARPFPPAAEFDPARGRAAEDQGAFFQSTLFGPELPAAVAAELDADPADVVVVDCLLRAVACLVEARPEPSVLLFHLLHRFHGGSPRRQRAPACRQGGLDAVQVRLDQFIRNRPCAAMHHQDWIAQRDSLSRVWNKRSSLASRSWGGTLPPCCRKNKGLHAHARRPVKQQNI